MAKWNFHRSAKRASSKPIVIATSPNRQKPSTGRWAFHDPATTREPEGHGWHHDEPETTRRKGKPVVGDRWTCDYGCKSFVWTQQPQPGQYHAWNCPYWHNEGRTLSPF